MTSTFYILPPTMAVECSRLIKFRCKTRCIGDGYSENTIVGCGWQATSIELGLLVAVEEGNKQRAWLNLITPTTQHSRRNRYQLMQILILHAASRRVWNGGHCLRTLHELAHMCDDAQDPTWKLAAGCKDECLGSELAKVDARQTVERRQSSCRCQIVTARSRMFVRESISKQWQNPRRSLTRRAHGHRKEPKR